MVCRAMFNEAIDFSSESENPLDMRAFTLQTVSSLNPRTGLPYRPAVIELMSNSRMGGWQRRPTWLVVVVQRHGALVFAVQLPRPIRPGLRHLLLSSDCGHPRMADCTATFTAVGLYPDVLCTCADGLSP